MPPLQLTSLLHTALPHVSAQGRALLSALGCLNGHPPGSSELAHWLGFHDRYQLARALRREGLPPLEVLGGWTRTLYWVMETETSGLTLRELAEREELDPAVAYRLVRRITGRRWSELRTEGLGVALLRFRDRCRKSRMAGRPQLAIAVGDAPGHGPRVTGEGDATPQPPPIRWAGPQRVGRRLRGVLGPRVPAPGAPFDVATVGDLALVARTHAAALDVLNLNPPRVVRTIAVGPVPTRVVPSARGHRAYVTTQFAEAVDVIDLQRVQPKTTIPVAGHPLGAVLSHDGQTLYVSTNRDRLLAIALARNAVSGEIAIPHGSPQLCLHPSGRRLYASGWRTGVVAEIEIPRLRLLRTLRVGGTAQDVLVAPDGQTLYVANEAGWLDAVHLPTGQGVARLDLGTAALGLALSSDESELIVSLLFAGRVLLVDRARLELRATVVTGGKPRLITTHRSGAALVANEGGWVDFIH